MAAVLAIAFITAISIFFYCIGSSRRRHGGLPPGPIGLPLVGSLPFFSKFVHRYFAGLAEAYGPVLSLRLGTKLFVVISSAAAAREVLKDHDLIFANRDVPAVTRASPYIHNDLLWSPYGPVWRTLRKVCVRELLSSARIEALRPLRRRTVTTVRARAAAGEAVPVLEMMFLTSLNVMTSMLWGVTVDMNSRGGTGGEFLEVIEGVIGLLAAPNVSDYFPALAALDLQGLGRKMKRFSNHYKRLLEEVSEERARCPDLDATETRSFLDVLVELVKKGDPQAPVNMENVGGLLMDLMGGGTDTSATTIEWTMAELLLHPTVMRKAQEELDAVVGGDRVVEEDDIPKLRYLDAVVKETFRLHPVLPLLVPHSPSAPCAVAGGRYTVPKGTSVCVNVWAIHRDPAFWEEPEEFKPERFLEEAAAEKFDFSGNNFNYMPFGSGRRICAGIALAEKMVMLMLASLLHSFDWRMEEGEEVDLTEKPGIVTKMEKPLRAVPAARLDQPELYD